MAQEVAVVFHFLGKMISHSWPLWLVGWLVLLAVLFQTAPAWDKVSEDREFVFLPKDAPSSQGDALFRQAFPNDPQASNVLIIASRTGQKLRDEDRTFIKDVVKPALLHLAREHGGLALTDEGTLAITPANAAQTGASGLPLVAAIRTLHDPGSGVLLVSQDGQATLVIVELTSELTEHRNWPLLDKTEKLIAAWQQQGQIPVGLQLHLTGSAAVGRDMIQGQRQSAQATEFWTIVLVIILLILIYRAPLLALIPLVSVYMATHISLLVLAHLAGAGIVTLFDGLQVFATIILYGTGVDYCLFLISRYREEVEQGAEWGDALAAAIGNVGAALASSAATVLCGIGMMVFASYGRFHHAGIAIPLSLLIGLSVVLTFTTSLLRLTGRWAFWPFVPRARDEREGREASNTTPSSLAPRPSPSSLAGWLSWEGLGQALLRWPAQIWLCTVLLLSPLAVYAILEGDALDYDLVRRLPPDAPSLVGLKALEAHFPAGVSGPVIVLLHHPQLDFSVRDGKGQIEINVLSDRLTRQRVELQLADIRSWSQPLGFSWIARKVAEETPVEMLLPARQQVLRYYVSDAGTLKGHVTRLELTMLANPLSHQGIALLAKIEEMIRTDLPGDLRQAQVFVIGTTASMRDLKQIAGRDRTRIEILVAGCVLLILMVLLRQIVVPLYLIASVLFSYLATLGAAQALFWWLDPEGFSGLDWKVPLFLFTILVAIGEDYNIFLMTRVGEEQRRHGPVQGIHVALVKTGRIITSCGLIMAGTFASLMAGTLSDLQHLGFALAFGVLMDTFVVRPILVPAFLILLERVRAVWGKFSATEEAAPRSEESRS